MDDLVLRGMAKWPNVPAVYGWVALDRRGNWLILNDPVSNPLVRSFMSRNYARDERGCWFVQNGTQRVFVELAYTPFVFRVDTAGAIHTQDEPEHRLLQEAWMDDEGNIVLNTDRGPGQVDDRDLSMVLGHIVTAAGAPADDEGLAGLVSEGNSTLPEQTPFRLQLGGVTVPLRRIAREQVPQRLGYILRPREEQT